MINTLIPINITVGDRTYRIKVNVADEQTVRQTVKIINDKIFAYKNEFPGKDMQDYITLALLWFATESSNKQVSMSQEQSLLEKLTQIDQALSAELKKV